MAFGRLLRLCQKAPGLRNASVGIATVTQESFESQNYVTQALFCARSLFTMTVPLITRGKFATLKSGIYNIVKKSGPF